MNEVLSRCVVKCLVRRFKIKNRRRQIICAIVNSTAHHSMARLDRFCEGISSEKIIHLKKTFAKIWNICMKKLYYLKKNPNFHMENVKALYLEFWQIFLYSEMKINDFPLEKKWEHFIHRIKKKDEAKFVHGCESKKVFWTIIGGEPYRSFILFIFPFFFLSLYLKIISYYNHTFIPFKA